MNYEQIGRLDHEIASLLSQHQDAAERLAEVPGLGVDSAQEIIAEPPRNASPHGWALAPATTRVQA